MKRTFLFLFCGICASASWGSSEVSLVGNTIRFLGNGIVCRSYDSRLGTAGGPLNGGGVNEYDDFLVASKNDAGEAIDLNTAFIYGYVKTEGGVLDYGPVGGVGSLGQPGVHDPSRVTNDFRALYPVSEIPLEYSNSDFTALPTPPRGSRSIVVPTGVYHFSSDVSISDTQTILIESGATVVWVIEGGHDIQVNGGLTIEAGATFIIYTDGSLDLGNSVYNYNLEYDSLKETSPAQSLVIYGINTTIGEQTIQIDAESGILSAMVHAPLADVDIRSGGGYLSFQGVIIGHDVRFLGSLEIWYDRALASVIIADSDADGLIDGDEASIHGTDPNLADTDKDGLSDHDEINLYASNPNERDTDGDGDIDGLEVFQGTSLSSESEHYGLQNVFYSQPQNLELKYRRSNLQSAITATGQWSDDLSNWYTSGQSANGITVTITESINGGGSGYEYVDVETEVTSGSTDSIFFRLALPSLDSQLSVQAESLSRVEL